jgi:C4-dicarboxylate-specific signal transduction histidine kinase
MEPLEAWTVRRSQWPASWVDLSLTKGLAATPDRLVQTQKLASLRQLTASIAHEIKNSLNFVNNFSSVSVELIDELQETLSAASLDDKTNHEDAELTNTLRDNSQRSCSTASGRTPSSRTVAGLARRLGRTSGA